MRCLAQTRLAQSGAGIIGTIVVIAVVIGLRVWNSTPHWEVIESSVDVIDADTAMIYSFETTASTDIRLSAVEVDGKPLAIYYLNQSDHNKVQSGAIDESTIKRMEAQTFVDSGQINTAVQQTFPRGHWNIYFECAEYDKEDKPQACKVDFTIEALQ